MSRIEATRGSIAEESTKTKKAREKLLKQIAFEQGLLTPDKIQDTVEKMHKWIADNASNREPVKKKNITLFNQNQDAAAMSSRVKGLAKKLQADMKNIGNLLEGS